MVFAEMVILMNHTLVIGHRQSVIGIITNWNFWGKNGSGKINDLRGKKGDV